MLYLAPRLTAPRALRLDQNFVILNITTRTSTTPALQPAPTVPLCPYSILTSSLKMAAAGGKELPLDPKYDDYDYPTTAPTPQNGHPGHTTPEQDAQVFQLRSILEQAGYTKNLDTLTMVRFLWPAESIGVSAG